MESLPAPATTFSIFERMSSPVTALVAKPVVRLMVKALEPAME